MLLFKATTTSIKWKDPLSVINLEMISHSIIIKCYMKHFDNEKDYKRRCNVVVIHVIILRAPLGNNKYSTLM